MLLEQRDQAKLPFSQQPARQHGVEDAIRHKGMILAQQAQIIIGSVQDQPVFFQFRPQRT
jgi:hypothetical protein